MDNTSKKISFVMIIKNVLFLALVLFMFRNGSFAASSIPKMFEILFTIVLICTAGYLVWNRKIKEFFLSIPKNVLGAVALLSVLIVCGWVVAVVIYHIPSTSNMTLEFGTFVIGIGTFLFVQFYAKDDETYAKKYLYALLAPTALVIFLVFPTIGSYLHLTKDGTFNGFTDNVNIVSKMFLVPIVFFTTSGFLEGKNIYRKIGYLALAAGSFGLVLWTSERGAILSAIVGVIFVWLITSMRNFSWKKIFAGIGIVLLIFIGGFIAIPHNGKLEVLDRVMHLDGNEYGYVNVKNESVFEFLKNYFEGKHRNYHVHADASSEPRIDIWSYYAKRALTYPVGIGPDTHVDAQIIFYGGVLINPGPHNTYIQLWLWSGLLGLFSFLYILGFAFSNIRTVVRSHFNVTTVSILGSLIAFSLTIFFNDSVSFFYFWALLGLALLPWNFQ
jgi:hypothetical protein